MLIKMSNTKELKQLSDEFKKFDKDGTGIIDAAELRQIFVDSSVEISEESITSIITELDYQGNGKINYSEFLAATVDLNTFCNDDRLHVVFNQLDTDNSGQLTHENIQYAMQKLGMDLPKHEIDQIMEKHDLSKNHGISFEEFRSIFHIEDDFTKSQKMRQDSITAPHVPFASQI